MLPSCYRSSVVRSDECSGTLLQHIIACQGGDRCPSSLPYKLDLPPQPMSPTHLQSSGCLTAGAKRKPYRTWLPTRKVRCRMRFCPVWCR